MDQLESWLVHELMQDKPVTREDLFLLACLTVCFAGVFVTGSTNRC